jgi:hypothetical protein
MAWLAAYQRQPGGLGALLAPEFDPLAHWPPARLPGVDVDRALEFALMCKYVQQEEKACEAFLQRSIAVAERVKSERFCEKEGRTSVCYLQVERAEAYARWVNSGMLDIALLQHAYDAAVAGAIETDDPSLRNQCALAAARMGAVQFDSALVADALRMLGDSPDRASATMRRVLDQLVRAMQSGTDLDYATASRNMGSLFECYRVPYPDKASVVSDSVSTTRFELAVLTEILHIRRAKVDLNRAYERVTA